MSTISRVQNSSRTGVWSTIVGNVTTGCSNATCETLREVEYINPAIFDIPYKKGNQSKMFYRCHQISQVTEFAVRCHQISQVTLNDNDYMHVWESEVDVMM